jgi:hypothetical protein
VSQSSIDNFGSVDHLVLASLPETSHFGGELTMEWASLVEAELSQRSLLI